MKLLGSHRGAGAVAVGLALMLAACSRNQAAPENRRIAFETYRDGNAEVYLMNEDGSELINLTQNEGYDGTPAWSPDGQCIAFTSERTGNPEIFVMSVDGSQVEQLTDGGGFNVVPEWSPDGQRILFASNRSYSIPMEGGEVRIPDNPKLWAIDYGSGEVERITGQLGLDMYGSWSPDGKQIVFMTVRDGNSEIYLLLDEEQVQNLTQNPARDLNPAWSPDGGKIAFMSDREGNMEIYIFDLESDGEPINITHHPANDGDPDWSPDGSKIAFTSDRDGNIEIYVMNADGSDVQRLTHHPGDDFHPRWEPAHP